MASYSSTVIISRSVIVCSLTAPTITDFVYGGSLFADLFYCSWSPFKLTETPADIRKRLLKQVFLLFQVPEIILERLSLGEGKVGFRSRLVIGPINPGNFAWHIIEGNPAPLAKGGVCF